MKRIVICYDGTWNAVTNPETVTNVVRVGQAVRKVSARDGTPQVVYYNAGVGSGGPIDRLLGGVFGVGLRNNVKRGLAFLALNWQPESEDTGPADEIYIFGFSRGAYSARALAGVIGAIGGIPKQQYFDRLEEIWDYYRLDPEARKARREAIREYIHVSISEEAGARKVPLIKCLGVWDTVGSYGIPEGLGLGALARKITSWTRGFHDNRIGAHIEVGLHAMAIDERRRAFPPTAWIIEKGRSAERRDVEQVWFAGTHSNIGGGYERSGLADLALIWMIARVSDLTGLDFDQDYVAEHFWPCAACSLYHSDRGWLVTSLRPFLRQVLKGSELVTVAPGGERRKVEVETLNEKVHWSVTERYGRLAIVDGSRNRVYSPSNLPKDLPRDVEFDLPALERRIAPKTRREAELIELCRKSGRNPRVKDCALFCKLPQAPASGGVAALQRALSAAARRARRLERLRRIWQVGPG